MTALSMLQTFNISPQSSPLAPSKRQFLTVGHASERSLKFGIEPVPVNGLAEKFSACAQKHTVPLSSRNRLSSFASRELHCLNTPLILDNASIWTTVKAMHLDFRKEKCVMAISSSFRKSVADVRKISA